RVHRDSEVLAVQLREHLLGIGEVRRMPGELAVARVPARRRELGSEIDEKIAGQLLLAERFRFGEDFVPARARPMRLLISESTERRNLGEAGDARILAHHDLRILRRDDEYIDGIRLFAARREYTARSREVEGAVRLMHEQRVAARDDHPLNR